LLLRSRPLLQSRLRLRSKLLLHLALPVVEAVLHTRTARSKSIGTLIPIITMIVISQRTSSE
jgi:hypothetical protein